MRSPSHTPARAGGTAAPRPTRGPVDPRITAALATLQQSLLTDAEPHHTLDEALDRYRDEHLLVAGLAPSTIAWREQTIAVLRRFGRRPVAGRWRDVAAQLYAEARRRGLREATPSLQVNTLSRVLRLAQSWGWRQDPHDLAGLCRVRSGRRTGVVPTDHLGAIWAALAGLDDRPRLHVAAECVRLVLWTGWRVSEAAGVRHEHVDLRAATVRLPSTKAGPQTRAVGREALEVLRRCPTSSPWCFPRRRGDGPVNRRHVLGALQHACEVVGVPLYPVHLLRHTWATVGAQLELPTVALAPALGHTVEWQTTEYQHVGHREVSRAADRVAAELRKAVGT